MPLSRLILANNPEDWEEVVKKCGRLKRNCSPQCSEILEIQEREEEGQTQAMIHYGDDEMYVQASQIGSPSFSTIKDAGVILSEVSHARVQRGQEG